MGLGYSTRRGTTPLLMRRGDTTYNWNGPIPTVITDDAL